MKPAICFVCGCTVARRRGYRGTVAEIREFSKSGTLIRLRRFCETHFPEHLAALAPVLR